MRGQNGRIGRQAADARVIVKRGWTYELLAVDTGSRGGVVDAAILCLRCGRTSYHLEDVAKLYCGACHHFHKK